jgi:hypothetical protein
MITLYLCGIGLICIINLLLQFTNVIVSELFIRTCMKYEQHQDDVRLAKDLIFFDKFNEFYALRDIVSVISIVSWTFACCVLSIFILV